MLEHFLVGAVSPLHVKSFKASFFVYKMTIFQGFTALNELRKRIVISCKLPYFKEF